MCVCIFIYTCISMLSHTFVPKCFSYFASRARASKCARARAYICIDLDKSPLKTYINVNCRVETK